MARQKARAPRLGGAYHGRYDLRTASNQGILHAKPIISLSRRQLRSYQKLSLYTLSLNLAGICGLSLPCGFDGAGLPVGLQLIAGAFAETRLLQTAYAYEQATEWHAKKPALPD